MFKKIFEKLSTTWLDVLLLSRASASDPPLPRNPPAGEQIFASDPFFDLRSSHQITSLVTMREAFLVNSLLGEFGMVMVALVAAS